MRVSPKLLNCRSMTNRLNKKILSRIFSLQYLTLFYPRHTWDSASPGSPHTPHQPTWTEMSTCPLPLFHSLFSVLKPAERSRQKTGFVSICARHSQNHRVQRVATAAFWLTFSHEGKISPGWWGWVVHAYPLSLHLPSPVKLQCTLQLSGQTH